MRKNIDISEDAVKALTIQAVHEGTVFKLYAEQILESAAQKPFTNLKNLKSVGKKKKK